MISHPAGGEKVERNELLPAGKRRKTDAELGLELGLCAKNPGVCTRPFGHSGHCRQAGTRASKAAEALLWQMLPGVGVQ